jgi:hypothetical protein
VDAARSRARAAVTDAAVEHINHLAGNSVAAQRSLDIIRLALANQ